VDVQHPGTPPFSVANATAVTRAARTPPGFIESDQKNGVVAILYRYCLDSSCVAISAKGFSHSRGLLGYTGREEMDAAH